MTEENNSLVVGLKLTPEQTKRISKYYNAFLRKEKNQLKNMLKHTRNTHKNSLKNDQNCVSIRLLMDTNQNNN
jgi:hypothetical protein